MKKKHIWATCVFIFICVIVGISIIYFNDFPNKIGKNESLLKIHYFTGTHEVDLENIIWDVVDLEIDADLALVIGNVVIDSLNNNLYDTSIYSNSEVITQVFETDKNYYAVHRYNTNYLGGGTTVIISKKDGGVHYIWVSA